MDGDLPDVVSCTVEVKVAQRRYAHKAFATPGRRRRGGLPVALVLVVQGLLAKAVAELALHNFAVVVGR